jgi:hypothetical protein
MNQPIISSPPPRRSVRELRGVTKQITFDLHSTMTHEEDEDEDACTPQKTRTRTLVFSTTLTYSHRNTHFTTTNVFAYTCAASSAIYSCGRPPPPARNSHVSSVPTPRPPLLYYLFHCWSASFMTEADDGHLSGGGASFFCSRAYPAPMSTVLKERTNSSIFMFV